MTIAEKFAQPIAVFAGSATGRLPSYSSERARALAVAARLQGGLAEAADTAAAHQVLSNALPELRALSAHYLPRKMPVDLEGQVQASLKAAAQRFYDMGISNPPLDTSGGGPSMGIGEFAGNVALFAVTGGLILAT